MFIVPQFSVTAINICLFFCSQINKWMRKKQQNQQKRSSPFLYFAADNSGEMKNVKTDHDQLKFCRSEVLYQIILLLSICNSLLIALKTV